MSFVTHNEQEMNRGRVGIEPTQDRASLPRNGFEDRTPHQQCSIPTSILPSRLSEY
jgi:hypothetical protein